MFLKPCLIVVNLVLGVTIWIIIILPSVLVIFVPFAILKFVVHFAAKHVKPDLIPLANPLDHITILRPSTKYCTMNESLIWKIRGRLDVLRFRKHFYETFLSTEEKRLKYRNFYCYFVQWMCYCFKKPVETIILEDQIREHKLGDCESLDKFIGKWLSINDYGNRPNWQMLIIHMKKDEMIEMDLKSEDLYESVLLFKIDHGLSDGYTLLHLTDMLTGNKSPYIVKKEKVGICKKIKEILTYPTGLLNLMYNLGTNQDVFAQLGLKRINDRLVSFTTLDLQAIKNVRRKTGTHFSTVIAIIQVQALRRFLLDTGKVSTTVKLPEFLWMGTPTGWPEHPAMVHGGMTNHLSINFFKNPFRDGNPLEMLLKAENEFMISEGIGLGKILWFFSPLAFLMPSPLLVWGVDNSNSNLNPSMSLSPLIFSNDPYFLLGHRVDHLYRPLQASGSIPHLKMAVVTVSICGQLDLSITGHPELFKSQEKLDLFTKVYLKEELEKLVNSCGLSLMGEKV